MYSPAAGNKYPLNLNLLLNLKKRPSTLPKQADGLTLKQPVAKIEIR